MYAFKQKFKCNHNSSFTKRNKDLIALPRPQSEYLKSISGTIRIYLEKFNRW